MLFYTAIGSCHNLWSLCAFTFLQVHTMGRLCLHAQVCAQECVQKCMFTRVSRVCERAFIVFKHCLVAVSVTDLSMSVCSEALSGTVHTVYIQTGCAGKKKYFHTLDNGGTDTMRTTYGYVWLSQSLLTLLQFVHFFFFFWTSMSDFWDQHFFSPNPSPAPSPLGVSVQLAHCWCIDSLRLTGLAVWMVNILPLQYNRVD